jgi:hypothetical protein
MRRYLPVLLNASALLSLALLFTAQFLAEPDLTTSTKAFLAISKGVLSDELPLNALSVRVVDGRLGHYKAVLPSPTYGSLFVKLPYGRISLDSARLLLLILPFGRLAVSAFARGWLLSIVAALSLALCVALIIWRLWGQPFTFRDTAMFWMGRREPPRGYWPMHTSYNLPVDGDEFPCGLAVALTLCIPIAWCSRSLFRKWRQSAMRLIAHCVQCGYDLRATPDRCPECGRFPTAKDVRLPGPGG